MSKHGNHNTATTKTSSEECVYHTVVCVLEQAGKDLLEGEQHEHAQGDRSDGKVLDGAFVGPQGADGDLGCDGAHSAGAWLGA